MNKEDIEKVIEIIAKFDIGTRLFELSTYQKHDLAEAIAKLHKESLIDFITYVDDNFIADLYNEPRFYVEQYLKHKEDEK